MAGGMDTNGSYRFPIRVHCLVRYSCPFVLDRIRTNRDLFPVGAIRDGEAGHGARAAQGQMDDATRELRRRDAGGHRRRDVRERRHLQMFTAAKFFVTARDVFAHLLVDGWELMVDGNCGTLARTLQKRIHYV